MGVRTAVLLLNAAMKANIIGLIVSLVIGLVAAFITLWKNNEGFRNFWIKLWDKIKSSCASAVKWIKSKFNDLKGVVSNVGKWFGDIKKSISDKIDGAWQSVKKAINKIKGLFPLKIGKIFSNLKIPKISVSGGKAPFGIAGKGSLPSFKVKWNADGVIFNKPTIFNTRQGLQGVGEAGAEVVSPVSKLMEYVTVAVKAENGNLGRIIIEQNELLRDLLRQIMPKEVTLDGNALVGQLLPAMDTGLADRLVYAQRGNVR